VDFIAMEFIDGQSLSRIIPTTGLPLKRALPIAIEIAGALAQAHAAGVVHRDLKPANVMLNSQGRAKLLDFGLAQRVRFGEDESPVVTAQGEISGTPAYMSPEQAEGQKADERSDVFSFGAVLYEMLTGRQPFAGSSATSVMASVYATTRRRSATFPSNWQSWWAAVCGRIHRGASSTWAMSAFCWKISVRKLYRHSRIRSRRHGVPRASSALPPGPVRCSWLPRQLSSRFSTRSASHRTLRIPRA
jgi:serine/threonine protein kinase